MLALETPIIPNPDAIPARKGPFDKKDSGIRERSSEPAMPEGEQLYEAREQEMQKYQTMQNQLIHFIDMSLEEIRRMNPDSDAEAILHELKQFPSMSTPLYAAYHDRIPATIFTELRGTDGHRIWTILSGLSFRLGLQKREAYQADKAVKEYEEDVRAAQYAAAAKTFEYWGEAERQEREDVLARLPRRAPINRL